MTKLLFDNYTCSLCVMPIYHIKKGSIKNIIFWAFCSIIRLKNSVCPYMIYGHTNIAAPITLSFFVQNLRFLYTNAQEMIIYQIC